MGEILLEWKDHDKCLSKKLWNFFTEEYLVDFSVTCHGQQTKVHKFILALMFPILKESLRSSSGPFGTTDQDNPPSMETFDSPAPQCLNLDNIAYHAEDMDYLMEFAYTGKTTVPNEHANCLMRIAKNMQFKSLKDSLCQWNNKRSKCQTKTVSRLRPRTKPKKKVYDESVDTISSDEDFDFDSIFDEESTQKDGIECFDECSEDDSRQQFRKKTTKRNVTSEKFLSTENANTGESLQSQDSIQRQVDVQEEPKERNDPDDTVEKDKILKCPQCDYLAKYPYRLERHLKSHAKKVAKGPKKFTCRICKKDLGSKSSLDVHRDLNCGTDPLVCKYCGHKTFRKSILLEHMIAKHQVDAEGNPLEKNVKCPDCNFVCYAKHQLRCHSSTKHERLNKFKCNFKDCNYTAPYINHLRKHERIKHQNRRDFMCEECGYRFQTSGALNRHVLVRHKGLKPYKCHICNAEYSDRLSFKVHMQRHEGKVEYKFVCHICGHSLRRKFELRIHLRKKHGIELEDVTTLARSEPTSTAF